MEGREVIYEEPLMVKLPVALKRRLKVEAARSDTDMSKITRNALTEYLDKLERRRQRSQTEPAAA